MTKEMIDTFIETGSVEQFSGKLDLIKFHNLFQHTLYTNAIYEIYNILDPDLKEYLCYKLFVTNGNEELAILFDGDVKDKVYNKIMNYNSMASSLENINTVKVRKILSLPDALKEKAFSEMSDQNKAVGLSNLGNDEEKLKNLKYLDSEDKKFMVLASIKNDKLKYDYIKSTDINNIKYFGEYFYIFVSSFQDKRIKYELLTSLLDRNVGKVSGYYATLLEYQSEEFQKHLIHKLSKNDFESLRKEKYFTKDSILNNINQILLYYFSDTSDLTLARERFAELVSKSEIYLSSVSFQLLNKDIFRIFDERFLNEIFLYPDIQDKINGIANFDLLNIASKLLNKYVANNGDSRWDRFFECIIDKLSADNYASLLNSFILNNSLDLDKLYMVMLQDNDFCIDTPTSLNDYLTIKREICDRLINGELIHPKYEYLCTLSAVEKAKYALLQKQYGITFLDAKRLLSQFEKDINNISVEDSKSKEIIDKIKSISAIINENDPETLKALYLKIGDNFSPNVDLIQLEKEVQVLYAKEYNKILFDPTIDGEILNSSGDIRLIDAGVDFNILMTSIAAYYRKQIDNYKNIWNNNFDFCASFIRNDMLGTAVIPNVCFGFSSMDEESLILSRPSNLGSRTDFFNTNAVQKSINFCTPDTQINMRGQDNANRIENTFKYNEMVFKKNLEGKIKQPDYILVFRENDVIPNMDKAIKASHDFENIPIVVIDKNKCAISELERLKVLISDYNKTGNKSLLKQIQTKVYNNSVANQFFVDKIGELLLDLNVSYDKDAYSFVTGYENTTSVR